jgi:hypothetical protein
LKEELLGECPSGRSSVEPEKMKVEKPKGNNQIVVKKNK